MLLFLTPLPVSHVYLIPLCALLCVLFVFFPFCKFPPPLFFLSRGIKVCIGYFLLGFVAVFVWEFVIFYFSFVSGGGVCMSSLSNTFVVSYIVLVLHCTLFLYIYFCLLRGAPEYSL